MVETCSYCGESGHSIQQCPKWRRKEVATATQSPPAVFIANINWYGETLPLYAFHGDLAVKRPEGYYISVSETSKISERELSKHLQYLIHEYKIPLTWQQLLDKLFESTHSSSPVRVEEMRHALEDMKTQLTRLGYPGEDIFDATLFAAKTTMKDASERRVFIQDFAASLNRKGLLPTEFVDAFCKHGYVYMEAASEHSSGFHVKYIDLPTGKTLEKDIEAREQHDLYALQREGKISIIEIKPIK